MLFDTHMHTTFSTDSQMKLTEALRRAKELDLGIIATEHMDLNNPEPGQFVFSVEDYFAAYREQRGERFLLGVEIGIAKSCIEKNKAVADSGDFDFILGSVHTVFDHDLYYRPFYEGKNKQTAYEEYFKAMYEGILTHSYINALGHIDYIARYAPYHDREITYHEFAASIDEVLKCIVDRQIALELNTRRFNDAAAVTALLAIYRRYYELGGRVVTLGSDSHRASELGGYFSAALAFMEQCGLKPVYFKARQMEYCSV